MTPGAVEFAATVRPLPRPKRPVCCKPVTATTAALGVGRARAVSTWGFRGRLHRHRSRAHTPTVESRPGVLRSSGPLYKHGNCRTSGLIVCADLELVVTSIDQISMLQRLRAPRHREVQPAADMTSRSVEQTSISPRCRSPVYWMTRETQW